MHRVCLSEYQIGRYPVTVGEYRLFVEAGGYEAERFWQAGGFGEYKEPDGWEDQLGVPDATGGECVLARSVCVRCVGGSCVADGGAVGAGGGRFRGAQVPVGQRRRRSEQAERSGPGRASEMFWCAC